MKYYTYGQTAQKIQKDTEGTIVYAVLPYGQFESDNPIDVMYRFASIVNAMPGKDRLKIDIGVKEVDDGDGYVIFAEYIPNGDGAKIARFATD